MIHRSIPEKLLALEELSKNLWWCWHDEARELFRMIDIDKWRECGHNPIVLLDSISLSRYRELENDELFVNKLEEVYRHFQEYMAEKQQMSGGGVAYFSMEYGLYRFLCVGVVSVFASIISFLLLGLDFNERATVLAMLKSFASKLRGGSK
jgi:phosphorylase/glycogen(starch) synthase